ncbi:hypothetical protein [Novosphingobium aquae]|uniref:Uncharacterized protein n=1 Tax=Novosphingobium aquae TaxID=3133435 RepID=A0ABU8SDS9_9SPHN
MTAITFGDARLNRIEEVRIPNRIAYFTQDEALIAANRHWLERTSSMPMACSIWSSRAGSWKSEAGSC